MKSDLPYLEHIADSIAAIEAYVSGGREVFLGERLIQDAVIRNFEIIGEAANRLAVSSRSRRDLPWRKIFAVAEDNSFPEPTDTWLLERRFAAGMERHREGFADIEIRGQPAHGRQSRATARGTVVSEDGWLAGT